MSYFCSLFFNELILYSSPNFMFGIYMFTVNLYAPYVPISNPYIYNAYYAPSY